MSNYTKTTDFEAKDSLPTGDSGKIIRGSEFETEFDAISTAIATKADTAGPTFTGTATFATTNATTVQIGGVAITSTAAELNTLDGITSTTAELNKLDGFTGTVDDLNYAKDLRASGVTAAEFDILDGLTATATELNILDGATVTTAELNILDGVTSTTAELNILDGVTATATEINLLDGVTATTAELNILDGVTSTAAELNILDGVTATATELNILDGVTATTAELNIMDGVTATTAELNYVDGVTSAIQTQLDAKAPTASPTFTGTVTVPGLTTTADVSFGDNDKAVFGAGSDLQIYHDPANGSYVSDQGVGSLNLLGSTYIRIKDATDSNTSAEFNPTGASAFYYNNAQKLATTSTGIDVTGTVTADGLTVDGNPVINDASPQLFFQTGATHYNWQLAAQENVNQAFEISSGALDAVASNDTYTKRFVIESSGDISFYEDTGTTAKFFWDASAETVEIASVGKLGATDGDLNIYSTASNHGGLRLGNGYVGPTNNAGTITDDAISLGLSGQRFTNLYLSDGVSSSGKNGSASVFNEGGTTADFRVESSSNTHMLFVDGGTNKVGIGTSSPNYLLDVEGTGALARVNSTSGNSLLQINVTDTTSITGINFGDSGSSSAGAIYYRHTGDSLAFTTAGAERMRIASSGNVGIGTSSPASKLHIENGTLEVNTDSSAAAVVRINYNSTDSIRRIHALETGGGNARPLQIQAQDIRFRDDTAERMRIDSSGNLLVGTTTSRGTRATIEGTSALVTAQGVLDINSTNALGANLGATVSLGGVSTSGGAKSRYAVIGGRKENATTGNYAGYFQIATTNGSGTTLERMRIDSTGDVLIGTTSAYGTNVLNVNGGIAIDGRNASTPGLCEKGDLDTGIWWPAADTIAVTNGGSESMRIDSNGFLNIGVSTAISSSTNTSDGFTFAPSGGYAWLSVSDTGGIYVQRQNDNSVFSFYRGSSNVGSISVTSSATSYNTSSDQRLKENIVDAPSASDDIDAIQVRSFDWKADGSHQKYGMVAQELQTVAPDAVTEGDAEEDMMAVDYSKLVPMLVKEIQSLRARVAELENS